MTTKPNLQHFDFDRPIFTTKQIVDVLEVPKATLDGWIVNGRISIAERLQAGRGKTRLFTFADALYVALLQKLLFGGLRLSAADHLCNKLDFRRSIIVKAIERPGYVVGVAHEPDSSHAGLMTDEGEVRGWEHWYLSEGGVPIGGPGTAHLVQMLVPLNLYLEPAFAALLKESHRSAKNRADDA